MIRLSLLLYISELTWPKDQEYICFMGKDLSRFKDIWCFLFDGGGGGIPSYSLEVRTFYSEGARTTSEAHDLQTIWCNLTQVSRKHMVMG